MFPITSSFIHNPFAKFQSPSVGHCTMPFQSIRAPSFLVSVEIDSAVPLMFWRYIYVYQDSLTTLKTASALLQSAIQLITNGDVVLHSIRKVSNQPWLTLGSYFCYLFFSSFFFLIQDPFLESPDNALRSQERCCGIFKNKVLKVSNIHNIIKLSVNETKLTSLLARTSARFHSLNYYLNI